MNEWSINWIYAENSQWFPTDDAAFIAKYFTSKSEIFYFLSKDETFYFISKDETFYFVSKDE